HHSAAHAGGGEARHRPGVVRRADLRQHPDELHASAVRLRAVLPARHRAEIDQDVGHLLGLDPMDRDDGDSRRLGHLLAGLGDLLDRPRPRHRPEENPARRAAPGSGAAPRPERTAETMMEFHQPGFWAAVGEIIVINILLSGDNAVVIALACRSLPQPQRRWGMIIGAGVASVLLIVSTGVVAALTALPYLKMAGSVALLWIAVRLLEEEEDEAEGKVEAAETLWRAVRIVVVADIIMSLDNVIAVAMAAKGNYLLLGLGLSVSIPIVIAGSAMIMWV